MSNAVLEAEVTNNTTVCPTTKIRLQDLTGPSAIAPEPTGDEPGPSQDERLSDKAVNKLYSLYRKNEVDGETFVAQLSHWLGYWVQDDPHLEISLEFLTEVADQIAEGKFGPTNVFAKTVRRKFVEHCRRFHPEHIIETKEQDPYAAAKKKEREDALTRAYVRWVEDPDRNEADFFVALRAHILPKVGWTLREFPEISDDADDFTQKALRKIWRCISGYKGGSEEIVSWVNKIVYRTQIDAFNAALKQKKTKVELIVDAEDEDGQIRRQQNPIVQDDYLFRHAKTEAPTLEWMVTHLKGIELAIVRGLVMGMKLKDIAQQMKLTQTNVKQIIYRMRKRRREEGARQVVDRTLEYSARRSGKPYRDWQHDEEEAIAWVRPPDKFGPIGNWPSFYAELNGLPSPVKIPLPRR